MKRISKSLMIISILIFTFSSCKNFSDLEKNPNKPTSLVPPSLILNNVLGQMYNQDEGPWSDVMKWNQFYISNYNYYGNNQYSWVTTDFQYLTLFNVVKMEQEAKKTYGKDLNPYRAIGKFLRAYYYNWMSERVGDIPTEATGALQGSTNLTPTYESQKKVYIEILQSLEESNADFTQLIANNDGTLAGDIYLNNSLTKWQKAVNTFKLRILISLSKKENDAELNIKQKFADIISNPGKYPVMTSNDDNMKFNYSQSYNLNLYPLLPSNLSSYNFRNNISSTFLTITDSLADPRTFIAATPAPERLNAGLSINDFGAYIGGASGADMATLGSDAQQKAKYSYVNAVRYSNSSVLPEAYILLGYPELCFNIAEGLNRGWAIGKNTETYYTNGISASMQWFGISDGGSINIGDLDGKPLGSVSTSLTNYFSQSTVKYAGDNAIGLKQILVQKYLAFFQNSGLEAFFNHRRTGFPQFSIGIGTGNGGRLPIRWQYPLSEKTTNSANYNAAIASQKFSTDDINQNIWLLQ